MKKKTLEKILAGLIVVAMTLTAGPASLHAGELIESAEEEDMIRNIYEEYISDEDILPDNDVLLEGYLQEQVRAETGENEIDNDKTARRENLSDLNCMIYDELSANIRKIAAGTLASSVFPAITFDPADYVTDNSKGYYSAAELGVSNLGSGNVFDKYMAKIGFSNRAIHKALLADMPYDLYWYDKVNGMDFSASYYMDTKTEGGIQKVKIDPEFTFSFYVEDSYSVSGSIKTTNVNTAKTKSACNVVATARSVVNANASKNNYQKLKSYNDWICEQVTYNTAAANDKTRNFGDPWQLIYVFDGDSSTNVVCEGYSKAFKLLCDLSTFSDSNMDCYLFSGNMGGGTGGGAHMWNTMLMDDGKYYLVDVTNCDNGSIGYPYKLFMVGYDGYSSNPASGFYVNCGSTRISYTYDDDTLSMFSASERTVESSDYDPDHVPDPAPVPVQAPVIKTQPPLALSLKKGDKTGNVISISAQTDEGCTLSYQWYESLTADSDGVMIAGATSAGYTIPTSTAVKKYYYCKVTATRTEDKETASVYSSKCEVTIVEPTEEDLSLTVTQEGCVFGTSLPDPVYNRPSESGVEVLLYTGTLRDGSSYNSITAPTQAGTYKVRVTYTVEGTGVYSGTSDDFVISPASISSAVVKLGTALTYTGSELSQTVSSVELDGNEIKDSCLISDDKGTDAGEYTLKITAKDTGNYTGEIEIGFTIAKAEHDKAVKNVSGMIGSEVTVDLTELIEQEGTPDKNGIVISDKDSVISGTPDLMGNTLIFEINSDAGLPGRTAQIEVPVKDARNYNDYNIAITVTVSDCMHENTEIRGVKAAACEEDGYSGDKYCLDCKQVIEEGYIIDKLGHDWGKGEVTKEANVYSEGIVLKTCSRCGEKSSETIPMKEKTETADEEALKTDSEDKDGKSTVIAESQKDKDKKQTVTTVLIAGEEVSRTVTKENGESDERTRIWIGGLKPSYKYTGSLLTPKLNVYDGVRKLTEKKDYKLKYTNNEKVGEAKITVSFAGNYENTPDRTVSFDITGLSLKNDCMVMNAVVQAKGTAGNEKIQYVIPRIINMSTGRQVPAKMVSASYKYLGEEEIECEGVSAPGVYKVTLTSVSPELEGTCEGTVTVISKEDNSRDLSKGKISISKSAKSKIWTGKEITLDHGTDFTIVDGNKETVLPSDVDITYLDNTEPGTAYIIVKAAGTNSRNYVGSIKGSFKIVKGKDIEQDGIEAEWEKTVSYQKGGAVPRITVRDGEKILEEGKDYTVKCKGNKTAGDHAEATVKGKGLYKGSLTLPYAVEKQDISAGGIVVYAEDMAGTKKGYTKVKITAVDKNGKKLGKADYGIDADSFVMVDDRGNYSVMVEGKGNYTGKTRVSYKCADDLLLISKAELWLGIDQKDYTGNAVTLTNEDLEGILSYDGEDLKPGTDFKVLYYSNNINKGTAKVTLQGINGYAGTRTLSFKISGKTGDYKGIYSGGRWK